VARSSARAGAWPPVLLEDWLRRYYFDARIDIGSSGVQVFTVAELCELVGLDPQALQAVPLDDSPSLGGTALRQAIASRWAEGNAQQVMVTHGSSEAMYLVIRTLVEPGDQVVVAEPCYQQLRSIAESTGARVTGWPLRAESGFVPDVDEGCALIRGGTRLVILNFPNNPTGATITPAELDALVGAAERAGAYLLWDTAFSELTYGAPPLPNPIRRYERAVSIGTLSKSYGLPGLRVGWCLGAPELLERLVRLRDYVTLNLSPLVELVATAAVRGADKLLELRLAQAAANRELLTEWAASLGPAVELAEPKGGVCAFPRLPGVPDVERLCRGLAERDGVLLVPGNCFGHPQHVRLGFGRATADVRQGLERLGEALLSEEQAETAALSACR
jgi:capreomycidine synthase